MWQRKERDDKTQGCVPRNEYTIGRGYWTVLTKGSIIRTTKTAIAVAKHCAKHFPSFIYSFLTLLLQWVICCKRQIRGRLREQRTRKGTNPCINALLSSGSTNDLPFHSIFPLRNWKSASAGLWHIAGPLQGLAPQRHTCNLAKTVFTGTKGRRKDILEHSKLLEACHVSPDPLLIRMPANALCEQEPW